VAIHDAGNVSDLALAREQEAAADARVTLARAVETRGVAHAELRRVMGVVDDVTWHTTPRLPDPDTAALSVAELTRIARSRRLDLRARRQDVETRARRLGFTRRFALLADGTIGLSYEREPDGVFAGGGLSLPIPLFDRGKARIARARAELRQAVALHDATVVDMAAEVRSRVARLEGARARALHLRRSVLPLRGRIVAETQRFVNAMQETVFTLLVARQSEIDAGQAYIDALREYWSARAELERVVGGSFAALSSDEVLALETAPSLLQPLSPIAR
jgi:cobalt-zinc-cadmium efflux system outer membrane protein